MKVVFLDCDGVLNSADRWPEIKRQGELYPICPQMVARLNRICLGGNAQIVVSSTWRLGQTADELQARFRAAGLDDRVAVVDTTPHLLQSARGREIQAWLDEADELPERFVILDDDSDMEHLMPRLVKTTWQRGLQDEHVDAALEILRSRSHD